MSGGDPESKVFVALWVVARKRGVGAATFDRLSRRHRMVGVNGHAQEIRIEFSTGRLRVHRSLFSRRSSRRYSASNIAEKNVASREGKLRHGTSGTLRQYFYLRAAISDCLLIGFIRATETLRNNCVSALGCRVVVGFYCDTRGKH